MRAARFVFWVAFAVVASTATVSAHEKHKHKPKPSQEATAPAEAPPAARISGLSEWQMFRAHAGKPEYLHVLLNPIPIYGTALGAFLLALSLFRPNEGVRKTGLGLVLATAVIVYPTIRLGQSAYDRIFETIPLEGQAWLDVHMERAEKFQFVFYLSGVLALAALILERRKPGLSARLSQATLASTALSAALAGWIAHSGGQVKHPEFREGLPPASALEKAPPQSAPERETLP